VAFPWALALEAAGMKDMLLIVGETDLLNLIQDMPGWQNVQVRYLSGEGHARYFNVHLTKKQVAFLGAAKIKATYHAEEYQQGGNKC
jgi:hypothetical protein